jgi:hypothetical protein
MPGVLLALALLVLCVLADHPDHPTAGDDLALDANLLHRCTDFHLVLPFSAHPFRARVFKNLLVAVNDPPAIQVVGTQLHGHAIAGQNADEVLAHPSRDMGQSLVIVLELDLEHGIRQRLRDHCHYLNRIFLRQTASTSAGALVPNRLVIPSVLLG